jgi:hypothetical protein
LLPAKQWLKETRRVLLLNVRMIVPSDALTAVVIYEIRLINSCLKWMLHSDSIPMPLKTADKRWVINIHSGWLSSRTVRVSVVTYWNSKKLLCSVHSNILFTIIVNLNN